MPASVIFETLFKWLFLLGLAITLTAYFYKDRLPDPAYYGSEGIAEPLQTEVEEQPFDVQVNGQKYTIEPQYAYELDGVVVSYHDADAIDDITHHKRWKDFLNLRDLCVIWGPNVASGVYHSMKFKNDSWTCWASWPDNATGELFKMNALSNNHLLTVDEKIAVALMSAEPGDHIRLKGFLAAYSNPGNGFHRGTSTTREDRGNGACETIFLQEFSVVNKANRKVRRFFSLAKWLTVFAGVGFALLFMIAPPQVKH